MAWTTEPFLPGWKAAHENGGTHQIIVVDQAT